MRCSVLDLGSNSFHVLVADLDGGRLVPVLREREMLHLGRVVAEHGGLPDEHLARAETTVAHLSDLAWRSGSRDHVAVATSALRDARDGEVVLARLSAAAGTPVRVLSGDEEARLAYLGVRDTVAVRDEPVLVADLGGGSLELVVGTGSVASGAGRGTVASGAGRGTELRWSTSLPLGVSRLSAGVREDPPSRRDLERLRQRVDDELDGVVDALRAAADGAVPATTIAVGGTVRALARVVAATDGTWLPGTTNQLRVSAARLVEVRDELSAVDLDGRREVPGMKSRRADHLHVAAHVLTRLLHRLGVDEVTVGDGGLREGLLLDARGLTAPPTADALRAGEVARLRRSFPTDDRHLDHLAALAGQLFDDLADVHGLGAADRDLLVHAARLHDVGETVALRRHPTHGAYLIVNAELRGFDPAEVAVLATLVRFHRSRGIDASYPPYAALSDADRDRTRALLPVLQLADRCDRTGDRGTREVTVVRDRDGITLEPVGAPLPVAPLELERTAALFERTYDVPLRFAAATATVAP